MMRTLAAAAIALTLALSQTAIAAPDVKTACEALVIDYAYYRDRGESDAFANLFTEDAHLEVLGEVWTGRAAIKARLDTAPEATPLLRHHMTTIRITPESEDRASGVSYATIYAGPPGAAPPLPATSFAAVGEYHDQFVRTAAGWKIARRVFVPVFMPPTP